MSKKFILDCLHNIFSYNIIGYKQYISRYKGFNGELHFSEWFTQNRPSLTTCNGGWFIPLVNTDDSLQDSIYIVISPYPAIDFCITQLQSVSNQLHTSRGQFLVQYDLNERLEDWLTLSIPAYDGPISIPYPSSLTIQQYNKSGNNLTSISIDEFFQITEFQPAFKKKANITDELKHEYIDKLMTYDLNSIIELYVSRFILDGLCSRFNTNGKLQRGAPLDVDLFVKGEDNKWSIIEIKEKFLSATNCFGMDTRRINSLLKLSNVFDSRAFYLVRQVENQPKRPFLGWMVIDMHKFNYITPLDEVEGGHGMRPENSDNPTRICNVTHFNELK